MLLRLKVQANAKKNEILEKIVIDKEIFYKIKIKAPKVDNKANKELVDFLSVMLGISKSSIKIIKGEKNALKLLDLDISSDEYQKIFN